MTAAASSGRIAVEWLRWARRVSRRLAVRVVIVAAIVPFALLLARVVEPLLPEGSASAIGAQSLANLLDIMASSMLTVTTFSVSAMVSVQFAASSQITHRAHRSLVQDTRTQTVLATYVGAWIYALLAIVVIATPYFGERELVALFFVTILVFALIVVVTLGWIIHLQTLGSLMGTGRAMEAAAIEAMHARIDLRTRPLDVEAIPEGALAIRATQTGYVQTVGELSLQALAERVDGRIWLLASPGRFIMEGQVIAHLEPTDEEAAAGVAAQIVVAAERTVEQDPRYGVLQIAEIASKALSPGVNDQGTAVDAMGRLARVLMAWESSTEAGERLDRVWSLPVRPEDIVADAFHTIGRDGAAMVEVQVTLQKRLAGLMTYGDPSLRPALEVAARDARDRALAAMESEVDRDLLQAALAEGVRG